MAITKQQKEEILATYQDWFKRSHAVILVEYTGLPPCKLFCVMADKCVPADCLLAMSQLKPRPAR